MTEHEIDNLAREIAADYLDGIEYLYVVEALEEEGIEEDKLARRVHEAIASRLSREIAVRGKNDKETKA